MSSSVKANKILKTVRRKTTKSKRKTRAIGEDGMVIKLMCQSDWAMGCPDSWLDLSGYVCEGVSKRD